MNDAAPIASADGLILVEAIHPASSELQWLAEMVDVLPRDAVADIRPCSALS